jgi:long-chain acyl-CoA synthetase
MTTTEAPSTAAAFPQRLDETTLVESFFKHVSRRASQPALYYRAGSRYAPITWGDFGRAVERWVGFLLDEGLAEHEYVGIWSSNRPEWHIADAGILSARAIPVPVYLTLSAEQAGYVLGHSGSRVVLVENEQLRDRVLAVRKQLPALQRIVVIEMEDAETDDGFVVSWQRALQRGEAAWPRHRTDGERRRRSVCLDDIATLIYTSGTTGPPKAVQLTHRNCAAALFALDEFVKSGPDDRVISYLPLAHIAERLSTEFRSYAYGNAVYFLDGFERLGERLREVRPTKFFGVPRVWEKMAVQVQRGVAALPQPRRALAQWALRVGSGTVATDGAQPRPGFAHRFADRLVLAKLRQLLGLDQATILASGAAPIAPEVLRFFHTIGLEVLEVYGQTEDTGLTTMNRPGKSRIGTVGTPLRGSEVRIADDGEILVKGGVVFIGYFKDDDATRETLVDGWLHTGDVGEIDNDGYLRITDRKKDLIITAGGKNISPSNIEQLLQQHRLIGHAVAIGDRRPFVSALLTLDADEISSYARSKGTDGDVEKPAGDDVRSEVEAHVAWVNKQLSHVEQVKKWTILPRDFAVGDELTPTLKVKRKVVAEKYSREIEALYER